MNTPHDIANNIMEKYNNRNLNEADTRHQIIDEIIHSVLSWPKSLTKCESFIDPGYADYRLKKNNGTDLLFIEAKKEGLYFNCPENFNTGALAKHIKVETLLTDNNIQKAIIQVRNYCIEEGCEFAVITNGHEWIFFKTFEKGKNWKKLKAFVIFSNKYFSDMFIEATNNFGYTAIRDGSLKNILGSISQLNREIFYPKDKINLYNQEVTSNNYARELRPLSNMFFGVIEADQSDFMTHCYVNQREYNHSYSNFRAIIRDSLTPYMEEYGINNFEDDCNGGKLGDRINKSIDLKKTGEVIVLFGGKGSGKSTFLKRLFYHDPPEYLTNNAVIATVDLLKVPEDETIIHNKIWSNIVTCLDVDGILSSKREELLKLFSDRFSIAKKQVLFGVNKSSDAYNIKLNDLVNEWLKDKKYIAQKLVGYWVRRKKGSIIVIDNTDQFPHNLQDFCFTTAQEISDNLRCLVIVSMREERFHSSRMHGTLDAYQNSGFHISSPVIQLVFKKRIDYVLSILENDDKCCSLFGDNYSKSRIEACKKLYKIFDNEFTNIRNSPLNEFLTACAHGNIRLALELFRDFVKSGYTNVDEMISSSDIWILKIHQVLKPVMIPYRFFYDEGESSIPNIYQIRSKTNGSHFTGLRILKRLSEGIDPSNPFYVSTNELKDFFSENYNMVEDYEKNLDYFLKRDLVESNNRIDYYCEDVDSIKITTYGLYIYKVLSAYFTYIELVSTDCGFFNERIATDIVEMSNNDYWLFANKRREKRVNTRLDKAELFISYLIEEEQKENEFYSLSTPSTFSKIIMEKFQAEKLLVLRSLSRKFYST